MTLDGGSNGVSTVFRVDLESLGYTVLHTFTTNGTDGQFPVGGVASTSRRKFVSLEVR